MELQTDVNAAPVHGIVTMPFAPYFDEDGITIYNADCRQVLPFVGRVDLLLTDPPYGIDIAKSGKVGGSNNAKAKDYGASDWDKEPPPRWFLDAAKEKAERAILWGGNYYEGLPPSRCWLVWHKNDTACNFADEHPWRREVQTPLVERLLARGHGQQGSEGSPDAKANGVDAMVSLIGARGTNGSRPLHGVRDDIGGRKARRPQGHWDRDERTILRGGGKQAGTTDSFLRLEQWKI